MIEIKKIDEAIKVLHAFVDWYWEQQKIYFDPNFVRERKAAETTIISLEAWKVYLETEKQDTANNPIM